MGPGSMDIEFTEQERAKIHLCKIAFLRFKEESDSLKEVISKDDIINLKISLNDPNSFFNKVGGKW